jgi:hypothetical protein
MLRPKEFMELFLRVDRAGIRDFITGVVKNDPEVRLRALEIYTFSKSPVSNAMKAMAREVLPRWEAYHEAGRKLLALGMIEIASETKGGRVAGRVFITKRGGGLMQHLGFKRVSFRKPAGEGIWGTRPQQGGLWVRPTSTRTGVAR